MKFDSKEFNENITSEDKLLEDSYVNNFLSEQKNPGVTTKKQGIKTTMGRGKTSSPEKKKVTDTDIQNAGADIIAPDIIALLSDYDTAISESLATKISEGFIGKAGKGGSYKKIFKEGLQNGTLSVKAGMNYGGEVEFGLNSSSSSTPKKNLRVYATGSDTNIPNLRLFREDESEPFKEFSNQNELTNFITSLNLKLFNEGTGEQYFIFPISKKTRKGERVWVSTNSTSGQALMMIKRPALIAKRDFINVVAPSTKSGGGTEGTTKQGKPTQVELDLAIDLSEAFPTEVATLDDAKVQELFKNKVKAELDKKGVVNFKAEQIKIVSSASNSWNKKWVAPTHSKSGQLLAGSTDSIGKQVPNNNYDFNQQPPSGTDDTSKNNILSWNRGQNLANAILSVKTEYYSGEGVTPSVEWRVTDTGGKVDKPGHEGSGQFARVYLSGVASKRIEGKPTSTPGKNKGVMSQVPVMISASDASGGRRISWFGAHRAKIVGKGGKFLPKRRATGTFSGLPKWLDSIIYSGI